MPTIIDRVKDRFHRDIASDPVTHGWVLNLYLEGERYPQRVCDYFQADFAPGEELARGPPAPRPRRGQARPALRPWPAPARPAAGRAPPGRRVQRGDPLVHPRHLPYPREPIRRRSAARKLANFLAHAHHLERRVARSFAYHMEACETAGQPAIAQPGGRGAQGREPSRAVTPARRCSSCSPAARPQAVMELHRRAEAKANLTFSARQVRAFLTQFQAVTPRHRRWLYRLSAFLMEGAGHLA